MAIERFQVGPQAIQMPAETFKVGTQAIKPATQAVQKCIQARAAWSWRSATPIEATGRASPPPK